jgi:hypothetical protein
MTTRAWIVLLVLAGTAPAAAEDPGKPVRALPLGTFVEGRLAGSDQDADGARSDVYRFSGGANDAVHVAATGPEGTTMHVQVVEVKTSRLLEPDPEVADPDAYERFSGDHRAKVDVTLPRDGEYEVTVRATRDDLTEDSPALTYRLGVSRDRVIRDVLRLGVKPSLGPTFHVSAGIGYGSLGLPAGSRHGEAITAHAGPGYQITERIGIDVIADVNVFLNPLDPPIVAFAATAGPRLRYGNKTSGFAGISAGPSYLTTITSLPDGDPEPQSSGFAARAEWALALGRSSKPGSKLTMRLFVQNMWHGESSYFAAGFATSR